MTNSTHLEANFLAAAEAGAAAVSTASELSAVVDPYIPARAFIPCSLGSKLLILSLI